MKTVDARMYVLISAPSDGLSGFRISPDCARASLVLDSSSQYQYLMAHSIHDVTLQGAVPVVKQDACLLQHSCFLKH